ncbi:MAG: radical SAM protein [Candidatus Omnitrophica bacterium]|nr:radical SAM protein [Candidatus Omnitrophota bacterium]
MSANYLSLDNDVFLKKIEEADKAMANCSLCAHCCALNRNAGELGFCAAGKDAQVACWQIHRGEEPPLAEKGGAGAIFFSYCSFKCVYCQNFQISQQKKIKHGISPKQLSSIMLKLQMQGAQNIDLVSPTHFLPQIIEAIYLAKQQGLSLPIVYNTNAYESKTALELISGIVDIYMPDFKYFDDSAALKYSGVKNYVSTAKQAIKIMYDQVGGFTVDPEGCACRGLLVRHLVLPEKLAGSFEVLDFLRQEIGVDIGLSIMSQYSPCYQAREIPELNRKVDSGLYNAVVERVEALGFEQCWIQELKSSDIYLPDFQSSRVFDGD